MANFALLKAHPDKFRRTKQCALHRMRKMDPKMIRTMKNPRCALWL